MGVPAFFRWLSQKYPSIVVYAKEKRNEIVDEHGNQVPEDWSGENPNDMEYDNLYLDMNGIIHPCTHPENKPAPKNEAEMFVAIFEYIDRLLNIIRPRRILYMAVDGVAPRAKMNQQRSRRFRAAKESREKEMTIDRLRHDLLEKGVQLPDKTSAGERFDSNCITPGTPFMARLAEALRYYIYDRLNSHPSWKGLQVFLSDANAPGEGEHKIMDFIRRQRSVPDHDANTKHCLCGADADLIMLGLATHEAHFTIIREEFKPNQPKPCDLCGQYGHEMQDCCGVAATYDADQPQPVPSSAEPEFIFIHLFILRQYLEIDLKQLALPFPWDFERAIDDWVFMCFFVGNDFLPHLPSLEIREGAIDRLIQLYKYTIDKTGGWLTENGSVNLARVQVIMQELGQAEDQIFRNRRHDEMQFRERQKQRQNGSFRQQRLDHSATREQARTPNQICVDLVEKNLKNLEAATALKAMMKPNSTRPLKRPGSDGDSGDPSPKKKVRSDECPRVGRLGGSGHKVLEMKIKESKEKADGLNESEVADKCDEVRLWEEGFRVRYYQSKFGVNIERFPEFAQQVALEYARGLCWVLAYYYQGCASWDWYYPYHYAPFASDFVGVADMDPGFKGVQTKPFNPLEQLMGVFPADSRSHVPPAWRPLMTDPDSPIIDFYPTDFKVDLNGKRYLWMGVALLPLVDEKRLLPALAARKEKLTEEERARNVRGPDRFFVHESHPLAPLISSMYRQMGKRPPQPGKLIPTDAIPLQPQLSAGISGLVWPDRDGVAYLPGERVPSGVPGLCKDIDASAQRSLGCAFADPVVAVDHVFPAVLLERAVLPKPVDLQPPSRGRGRGRGGPSRGGFGRGAESFGRSNGADDGRPNRNPHMNRVIEHSMQHHRGGRGGRGGGYHGGHLTNNYSNSGNYNYNSGYNYGNMAPAPSHYEYNTASYDARGGGHHRQDWGSHMSYGYHQAMRPPVDRGYSHPQQPRQDYGNPRHHNVPAAWRPPRGPRYPRRY